MWGALPALQGRLSEPSQVRRGGVRGRWGGGGGPVGLEFLRPHLEAVLLAPLAVGRVQLADLKLDFAPLSLDALNDQNHAGEGTRKLPASIEVAIYGC